MNPVASFPLLRRRQSSEGRTLASLGLLSAATLLLWTGFASAQTAGTLKTSFDPANAVNGTVSSAIVQPDGKVVVGVSNSIVRLNTDGSVDTSFNAPDLGRVVNLAASPYEKTVAVFETATSGPGIFQIVRLLAGGTLDTSFPPVTIYGSSTSDEIYEVTLGVQADGKVIAGGYFADSAADQPSIRLLRYNADGTADTTFQLPASTVNVIAYNAAVPQANGKILVAYDTVTTYPNYLQQGQIILLNADGSIDASYHADLGEAKEVYAPTLLPDGRTVYLATLPQEPAPTFNLRGGVPRRVNADGTADTNFEPQFAAGASFSSLVVESDGKIVVGGYTADYSVPTSGGNSQTEDPAGVARLNTDGTADASFNAGTGAEEYGSVVRTLVAPDGSVVVAGNFGTFDGQTRLGVAELNGDGGLNLPFFDGEATLSNGVDYLALPGGGFFGYYSFLSDPHYLYHFDLGYEYVFDANDGTDGVYLYDFVSNSFFYTSVSFPFPYLYDFTLDTVLYYYPDPQHPGRYNMDGVRYFYDFAAGKVISK